VIYCDDVSGKGHVTRSISDVRLAFINRAKACASGARADLFPGKGRSMKTYTGKILIDNTRGMKFTESPRWHDGKLWFLDIHDKRIKTVDLGGRIETAEELGFIPNAFGFRRDGSILVGDAMQRKIYRWDGKALQPLADISGMTAFCLSDGIVDARTGCMWETSATASLIPS
jgi:sugar lactone lactonase YvrE